MKKLFALTAVFFALAGLAKIASAGPEPLPSGKEMKQVAPAPCPEWYADNEWNVSVWGTYAFTGTESSRTKIEIADDEQKFGSYDRFLGDDHAWGGGLDAKYFFHRYFGIGIEGFALAGKGTHANFDSGPNAVSEEFYSNHDHTVGGVLGTLTLRYPIHCSRFSPYGWAGAGGMFGGFNDHTFVSGFESRVTIDEESRFVGQFGGGLEVRITPHIGLTGDFSWNVVDGPSNNFGMVRSGLNFDF